MTCRTLHSWGSLCLLTWVFFWAEVLHKRTLTRVECRGCMLDDSHHTIWNISGSISLVHLRTLGVKTNDCISTMDLNFGVKTHLDMSFFTLYAAPPGLSMAAAWHVVAKVKVVIWHEDGDFITFADLHQQGSLGAMGARSPTRS
jgi:hypothetical protein